MNYRNRQLLDLAHRVTECQWCGQSTPDGCEPAHSNASWHGKGASIKAHDCYHAALCHDCHMHVDAGRRDRQIALEMWRAAFERTMLLYFRNGWLKVTK